MAQTRVNYAAYTATLFLTLALPFLYNRWTALSFFWLNHPSKVTPYSRWPTAVKFADQVRDCEDVLLIEERSLAILSCDEGRERWNAVMGVFSNPAGFGTLYIYNYGSPDPSEAARLVPTTLDSYPHPTEFHPLGIEHYYSHRTNTSTLVVANHISTGPRLDVFHLSIADDLTTATATHQYTIAHPLLSLPNSITVLDDNSWLVTNSLRHRPHPVSPLRNALKHFEVFFGVAWGAVISVIILPTSDPANPDIEVSEVARLPFANGITRFRPSLGAHHIAVAGSNAPGVFLYQLARPDHGTAVDRTFRSTGTPVLTKENFIRTPYYVDNISVDSEGKLLLAGHPNNPALARMANGIGACRLGQNWSLRKECEELHAPSWVQMWSPEEGLRDAYKSHGHTGKGGFGSSTTAVRDAKKGVGFVTGLYERGILVWDESVN